MRPDRLPTHEMANNKDADLRGLVQVAAYPIKPGASFKKGDFLIWTATGLDMIAANTNYAPTTNTTRIAGRALHDSTVNGVAYTHADIELCVPGAKFPIALPSGVAPALAQLAVAYELKNDANGIPRIDTTATTNVAVRVVDFVPTSGTPDNTGWPDSVSGAVNGALAFVEFVGSACAFTGAR